MELSMNEKIKDIVRFAEFFDEDEHEKTLREIFHSNVSLFHIS